MVSRTKSRRRLDAELVRRGLCQSRDVAQRSIGKGQVLVAGAIASKSSHLVAANTPIELLGPRARYVSRGGNKLDAALSRFGIDVRGRCAVDVGSSTGGFTDCLLGRGALHVVCIDVGHGQLDIELRNDPRVTVLEKLNVRSLHGDSLPEVLKGDGSFVPADIVVADVSFISLGLVLPVIFDCLVKENGTLVSLVKPQFEAGRVEVSKAKGVIKDPLIWRDALEAVVRSIEDGGWSVTNVMASPLRGACGNVEFLLAARKSNEQGPRDASHLLDGALCELEPSDIFLEGLENG